MNTQRIDWIDQVKGFGIILVVYGHNFPIIEDYIYSFHMPLFFLLAGIFHPKKSNFQVIKKRVQQILIPYFLWSFLLFIFWFFIGRKFGESSLLDLSPLKNFIGIFFSQGDTTYMNWGIPMWFLPSLFLTFLIFYLIQKIKNSILKIILCLTCIIIGFILPTVFNVYFFWSFDVSLVGLTFYAFGFYTKKIILQKSQKKEYLLILFFLIVHSILSFLIVQKVDMYRSIYGNASLFIINAISGVLFWLLLIKNFNKFTFLSFFGKNTIPILALQIRAMTFIKLMILLFFGTKIFNFNEFEKVVSSLLQLALIYPIIILINKYAPQLNGKIKKI